MTDQTISSPQSLARFFVIAAIVEAVTWTLLLIGMYFKYVPASTEVGVQIAGPIHGMAFLTYVGIAWFAADKLGWSGRITALALLAAFPPFGTVVFERWAKRRGLLAA